MNTKKALLPIATILLLFCACNQNNQEQTNNTNRQAEQVTEQQPMARKSTVEEAEKFLEQYKSAEQEEPSGYTPTYLPALSFKTVDGRKWTASNVGLAIKKIGILDEKQDTLGTMANANSVFTWTEAIEACPIGFRLPRRDEFLQRQGKDLGIGSWWTSNIVKMYTTKRHVENSEYPEITPHVFAAVAKTSEYDNSISFLETNIQEKHSVLCISDTSKYISEAISDIPNKITTKSGTITNISFEPHYAMEGCDCCCQEGSGGTLRIHLDTEKDTSKDEFVYEYGHDDICIPQDLENRENFFQPINPQNCLSAEIYNLDFLPLFQMGALFKRKSCSYSGYTISTIGSDPFISEFSCGDTITVSFIGEVQKISHFTQRDEFGYDDSETSNLCTYRIFNPDNGNTISTTHKCKDLQVGSTYKIKGTITYSDDLPNYHSVFNHRLYPCCDWRGDLGDTYASLDFEPVVTPSEP